MSYPPRDDLPYLDWASPDFSSVFIAFNPFIHMPDAPPPAQGRWLAEDLQRRAKAMGPSCAVTWNEMARRCGFGAVAEVNQALRGAGSGRLAPRYASRQRTASLLARCEAARVHPPDEGTLSPLLELSMGSFLKVLGLGKVVGGDGFASLREATSPEQLLDPDTPCGFRDFGAEDGSLFVTLYTDYHYVLICQTEASLKAARPDCVFEGFYADAATSDLWGLPGPHLGG